MAIFYSLLGIVNPFMGILLNIITLPLRTLLGNLTYDFLNSRLQ